MYKVFKVVFKVSRMFSTRLTPVDSYEIDSTHSSFDSRVDFAKNLRKRACKVSIFCLKVVHFSLCIFSCQVIGLIENFN